MTVPEQYQKEAKAWTRLVMPGTRKKGDDAPWRLGLVRRGVEAYGEGATYDEAKANAIEALAVELFDHDQKTMGVEMPA